MSGAATGSSTTDRALIVSVKAKRIADLYNRIVLRYRGQLEALVPVVEIPVRIKPTDQD
jgi:hypothetical protein